MKRYKQANEEIRVPDELRGRVLTGTQRTAPRRAVVLATAAGSNTLTHINDASFWLFKGYFDLSVKDTLKTWGLLELVNSVVGLIIVLIISMVA